MISIKEIARLAGVSAKTAERALSGATKDKRRDARERAGKVREIAASHGYQPSELALALRRGSTQSIGFLSDVLTDQFLAAAAETIMDEAAKNHYRTSLKIARFDKGQTEEEIKSFLASGVNAIITSCVSRQLPEHIFHTLEKNSYPVFTLCGRSTFDFSSVAPDYSSALPQAVGFLAEKGHKKIILSLFDGKEYDNKVTENLFRKSCRKNKVDGEVRTHTSLQQAADLAGEMPKAVILYGKYSMRLFIDRCMQKNHIPDIIGFYNEWTSASALKFPLQGIILEQAENAVRFAVRQVIGELNGEKRCHKLFTAKFVKKEEFSCLKLPDLANQRLFDIQ